MQLIPIAAAVVAGGTEAYKAYQTKKAKDEEARFLREAKNRSMAATTAEMAEEQRQKELMESRAIAVAGASGAGGISDPTVNKLVADLNAEGEYRVLSVLYRGQVEAGGLIHQANVAEKEGEAALVAGALNAITSAAKAYASMGGSFGGAGAAGAGASAGGASGGVTGGGTGTGSAVARPPA